MISLYFYFDFPDELWHSAPFHMFISHLGKLLWVLICILTIFIGLLVFFIDLLVIHCQIYVLQISFLIL